MDFVERVKDMTRDQVVNTMIGLLTHVSPDTFMKLSILASRLIQGDQANAAVDAVIESLREGENGQAARMFKRVMTQLSPHCLKTVARNLFINGLLRSSSIRADFEKREGFGPPFTILISPTAQCNLQCTGCYSGKYVREKGLSYELMDRLLGEARDIGALFIVLSGGEPLTRKDDLFPLIEKYNDMYFMFYTNGTLINDAVADELYRLGNAGAIMSLEGFEEDTDARRGNGVFKKVMATMDRLRERGVPFGTSLTVTSRNVEKLTSDDFFAHLADKGVMVCWFFLFMPVGKDPDVSLMPSPEQREYLRQRGTALRAKYPIFIADFWNDAPYVGGCIAGGRNYIHINANGDVEPCVFTHFAVDKIHEKTLSEVLHSDFFATIRSKQPYSENLLTPCMIIDNPDVYRTVVRACGAYPTHDGAEDVIVKIKDDLDDYGRRVRALEDEVWATVKHEFGYTDAGRAI
ncbi:MAG: radical SAM protein [Desulfomonile tiedjei]|nr:radical SAM protein [Desulfomonile tiedjei]